MGETILHGVHRLLAAGSIGKLVDKAALACESCCLGVVAVDTAATLVVMLLSWCNRVVMLLACSIMAE